MASEIIERTMYAGRYKLVHNPNAKGRSPRYTVTTTQTGDVRKPKGVTTILGGVIAKDLTSWAVGACVDLLRTRLPVITQADLDEASKSYLTKRDAGANTGAEAHAMVEQYLKKQKPSVSTATKEAQNAYGAFVDWFTEVNPEVINVEEVVYSEEFDYPGTYDCILRIENKVYLCDLKTTNPSKKAPNGVYPENFLQLGAYATAHEEQRQFDKELVGIDGLMVISAKKNGVLDIVTNDQLGLSVDDCKTMWKRVVNLHNFLNYTTEALGGK